MKLIKDNIIENEEIAITYHVLKKGKWKIKTEIIKSEDLADYEKLYRVLYITTVKKHYQLLAKLKGGNK